MQATLTDGTTSVVICHGSQYAGQTGYYVGPLDRDVTDVEWTLRERRPVRADTAIPLDGRLAVRTYPLQVYIECADEAAATALRDSLPDSLPRGPDVTLQVLHDAHTLDTYANAVVSKISIDRNGVLLLVTYAIRVGTRTRSDPDPE
jgi:hypothetical protein